MSLRGVDWERGVIEIDATYSKFNNELTEEARAALNFVKNEMAGKSTAMAIEKKYTITHEDINSYIDDTLIPDAIMEEAGFSIIERTEEILNLEEIFCNAKRSGSDDTGLIECNIDELKNLKDGYIFSSTSAIEYISHGGTPETFNNKCEEILNEVQKNG